MDYYSYIWTDDPIIKGVISQSSTVHMQGPFAPAAIEDRHASWFGLSKRVGCGGAEAGLGSVACMETKKTAEIQAKMPQANVVMGIDGFFGPTYDDTYIFTDYDAQAAAGKFIQVVWRAFAPAA